jgi:ArsR family transcriptional regulator, lead/cadmium/zinc/bismuth-responsive transcriptional repressor
VPARRLPPLETIPPNAVRYEHMNSRSYVPDLCDVVHLHPARVTELRAALIGEGEVTDLAETFRALGDPTRVRILDALSHGELCVCDLAALVRMSESAVSHQLRLLRNLRLVKPRREGRMVFYALDDRHIMSLFRQGLRHVQENERVGRKPRRISEPGHAR